LAQSRKDHYDYRQTIILEGVIRRSVAPKLVIQVSLNKAGEGKKKGDSRRPSLTTILAGKSEI